MKYIIVALMTFTSCNQLTEDKNGQQYSAEAHASASTRAAKPFKVQGKIFKIADTPPVFPGGPVEMNSFIKNNLKYPAEAVTKHVEGKVFVKFVINKNGEIGNVHVIRGIGFDCDEAAVDLVHAMPAWTPAENKGEKVNVHYTLPIIFKLPHR